MNEKIIKKNGNDSLLSLFKNNEKDLLDFIFENSYFLNKENMNIYKNNNNYIRNGKSNKLYYCNSKNEHILLKKTKHLKNRLLKFSKNNNLYYKKNNEYINVKIDTTGNAAPKKFITKHLKIDLQNRNYKISHLEKKPNTPEKHGFENIIITPSFLDHFIDQNIILNNINVNNAAKLIAKNLYNLGDDYFENFIPSEEEIIYSKTIFPNLL